MVQSKVHNIYKNVYGKSVSSSLGVPSSEHTELSFILASLILHLLLTFQYYCLLTMPTCPLGYCVCIGLGL
jgi:hypothetical protein